MRVSIITVVYNGESTINDTIQSILGQTYKDIEYIVIDGGSNDRTLEILEKYKDQISVIVSEKDKGIYDAMNKGVNLASGEIIGILNSDDVYYDCNVIQSILVAFKENSSLDACYTDLIYVDKLDLNKVVRYWKSRKYYSNFFQDGHVPPHPTLFLKKSVYIQHGLYNIDFKVASDYEFMLRILKLQNVESNYLPFISVKMRLGGESNKSLTNIMRGNKEIFRAWKLNGVKIPFLLFPKRLFKKLIQFKVK